MKKTFVGVSQYSIKCRDPQNRDTTFVIVTQQKGRKRSCGAAGEMLYADKQALETDLKVSLLSIRERELNLYTTNCRSIGTQAALLAGFAYGGCCLASYFFPEESSGALRAAYLVVTTCAMDLNVAALLASTICTMLGPGLALRGPDGSVEQAVEGLALEFRLTFVIFFLGLFSFYLSAMLYVMIVLNPILSALLTLLMAAFIRHTFVSLKRIYKKFRLPSHRAVTGDFATDGSTGGTVLSPGELSRDMHRLTRICEWKRPWQVCICTCIPTAPTLTRRSLSTHTHNEGLGPSSPRRPPHPIQL